MGAKNPSFVLEAVKKVKFEDRPVPTIQHPHDVMINVKYTGVCGSDVHYWDHGAIGHLVLKEPMVLGHESSGIIISVGPGVTSLKPGDRVALEPGVPCRQCEACKGGKYNLCDDMRFAATPPYDGTLAKYYILPEDFCYKIPESMDLQEAALMEPLSVAVHITKQGAVKPGDQVVVFGAGPVGLLCCAVARAFGASKVIAVDVQQVRLHFARKYAATATFMPGSIPAAENAQRLKEQCGLGRGADVVLDASGAEPSAQTGIHALRPGGIYVQGGMGRAEFSVPIMVVCTREISVKGSFRYSSGDYKLALELVETGKINVRDLITKVVRFTDAEQAIIEVKAGKGIKTLISGVED
ncbi:xylitol dehydrogenase [Coccidioides posadasii str. Silveira]|uniref:D-xylulose reductase n=2 Tax=Coccidioides posadasii TaxID=199306 RepID=E9DHT5_COCPS|nr:xylitol dehydrogenase [Coccidioides posadasii str. Silveira]KMM69488.1 sorbitol dehydrogenase 2 [Coccidioides posadasii RMSCC 3488]